MTASLRRRAETVSEASGPEKRAGVQERASD